MFVLLILQCMMYRKTSCSCIDYDYCYQIIVQFESRKWKSISIIYQIAFNYKLLFNILNTIDKPGGEQCLT